MLDAFKGCCFFFFSSSFFSGFPSIPSKCRFLETRPFALPSDPQEVSHSRRRRLQMISGRRRRHLCCGGGVRTLKAGVRIRKVFSHSKGGKSMTGPTSNNFNLLLVFFHCPLLILKGIDFTTVFSIFAGGLSKWTTNSPHLDLLGLDQARGKQTVWTCMVIFRKLQTPISKGQSASRLVFPFVHFMFAFVAPSSV